MKTKLIALLTFIVMLAIPSLALAQVKANSFHVSPMVGYLIPDSKLAIDNGVQYSLGLGYNFTENWGIEIVGSYAPSMGLSDNFDHGYNPFNNTWTQFYQDGDADITQARLNAIYHFSTNSRFVPYLTAGVGGMRASYDRNTIPAEMAYANGMYGGNSYDDYNSFAINGGLGFKLFLSEYVALRVEALDTYAFKDSGTNNFSVNAGLTFQFGGAGDCNDADNDGVCDEFDKCPGTPAGYKVDADGCPITVSIRMDVKFDFDKDVVKKEYYPEVSKVADFMKSHPGTTTVVEGHTDSVGSDAYNQKLSQRRANAVRSCLVSVFGVDSSRLQAIGYGEARPEATNDTDSGRAQNRRVVGSVTGTDIDQ